MWEIQNLRFPMPYYSLPRGPGVFMVLPCMDAMVMVDLRTGVHDIPPQVKHTHLGAMKFQQDHSQDILTADSVAVSADAVLYYRVHDPLLAVVGNENYAAATIFKVF
jgi:regulator of protease activity HflC (stomatin/prohibitin superfamily)